jgi:hypothetical protein
VAAVGWIKLDKLNVWLSEKPWLPRSHHVAAN